MFLLLFYIFYDIATSELHYITKLLLLLWQVWPPWRQQCGLGAPQHYASLSHDTEEQADIGDTEDLGDSSYSRLVSTGVEVQDIVATGDSSYSRLVSTGVEVQDLVSTGDSSYSRLVSAEVEVQDIVATGDGCIRH